jgi:hypothetical protein
MNAPAAVYAGVAAGVVSTLAQIVLWLTFTDAFPEILFRDVRLTAAIILGPDVLEPASAAGVHVWIVAALVHFALSLAYAVVLAAAIRRLGIGASLVAGGLFGLAVYALNMHGFTRVFPWFEAARDPITVAAHVVFGVSAALVYRHFARRS